MTTPYRDDKEALESKIASLAGELERTKQNLKSLGDEQKTAERLEGEIATLRGQLEDRERRGPLDQVQVAAPCNADWNEMVGDDRVRFCGSCQKNVFNLSAMKRAEAEALVAKHDGPASGGSGERSATPCIRLYRRLDGTVITNDCPVGRKRRRFRRIVAASVGGALITAGAMFARWRTSSCGVMTQGEMMPVQAPTVMGSMAVPAPPPPPPTAEPRHTMGKMKAPSND